MNNNAAVAVIQFVLHAEEGIEYLRLWNEGEFDKCREYWPEASQECYIGADPLLPQQGEEQTDLISQIEMCIEVYAGSYDRMGGNVSVKSVAFDLRHFTPF